MSEVIKLVQGDTRPQLRVTLTDETTGEAIDISGSTCRMFFRAMGEDGILDTLNGVITNGVGGQVVFSWNPTTLVSAEGDYEGEVQVTFPDDTIQSIYKPLRFRVRADF